MKRTHVCIIFKNLYICETAEEKESVWVNRGCIFALANIFTRQEFLVSFSEISSLWQFGTCMAGCYALSQVQVYGVYFYYVFSLNTFSTMECTLLCLHTVRGIIFGWNDCMWQQYEEPEITLMRGSASWQHVKADAVLRAVCSNACRRCYRVRTWTFPHR